MRLLLCACTAPTFTLIHTTAIASAAMILDRRIDPRIPDSFIDCSLAALPALPPAPLARSRPFCGRHGLVSYSECPAGGVFFRMQNYATSVVTQISAQRRSPDRVNLYVDGQFL